MAELKPLKCGHREGCAITFDEPSELSDTWYANIWIRQFRVGHAIASSLEDCERQTVDEITRIREAAARLGK